MDTRRCGIRQEEQRDSSSSFRARYPCQPLSCLIARRQCHALPTGLLPAHRRRYRPKPAWQAASHSPRDPGVPPRPAALGDEPSRSRAHRAHADRRCHAGHPCSVTIKWHEVLRTCRASLLCHKVSACTVETMQSIPPLSRGISMQCQDHAGYPSPGTVYWHARHPYPTTAG